MMVEVTQEDREAAAAFYSAWGGTKGWSHLEKPIREGIVDDNALVQTLARHRIAAAQRCKLEGARLALEAAGDEIFVWRILGDMTDEDAEASRCLEVIRALDPAKIVGEG